MPITQRNIPVLHRKEWQMMTVLPAASVSGTLFIADPMGLADTALYITNSTTHWLYSHSQDSYVQIPSGTLSGTFAAGSCGIYYPWSITYTANGGSTTSATVLASTHNITNLAIGATIEFISSGSNSGLRRKITDIITNGGAGNVALILNEALPSSVLNGHTFRLSTGRFFIMGSGSVAAGIWKSFDCGTLAWSGNLGITGLPSSWGTEGRLACACSPEVNYASGTATAGTSSTLTNSSKTWATNQWANYQIRITSGTGIGQIRTIASNTATIVTIGSAWSTTPDATSAYAIEGNEDFIYLLGNSAITMYRYSISANAWTTMTPTTARAAVPGAGMSADFVLKTKNSVWADESNIQDGRYIYSLRGNTTTSIDRFDIAGGTSGAGAWANVIYGGNETFGNGTNATAFGAQIYIRKDNLHRFFAYSVTGNFLSPLAVNFVADGSAVAGHRLWVKSLDEVNTVTWLYSSGSATTLVYRIMLY